MKQQNTPCAAIAAAEFLQTNFPDRTGFSPRNVRRMRDFYKVYENDELLLRLAMKIGWTLDVVIVEAALARDERKWYLEQALCRGWSKTQLLNAIRSGIDCVIIVYRRGCHWFAFRFLFFGLIHSVQLTQNDKIRTCS